MSIETSNNTDGKSNFETLTAKELKDLKSAEASIRNGLKSYQSVGKALSAIAHGRLYKATHSTMVSYAKDKWDMTTARVSQYQHAYRVHELLTSVQIKPLPKTESQCRPLARIPEDENMDQRIIKVWLAVIDSKETITAKLVNACVDDELGIDRVHDDERKQDEKEAKAKAEAERKAKAGQQDEASASAELRAELRDLKRKVAYLESALAAEQAAHKRTESAGSIPRSSMARRLFKAGFRVLAKQCHPDHGGKSEDMQELNSLKATLAI